MRARKGFRSTVILSLSLIIFASGGYPLRAQTQNSLTFQTKFFSSEREGPAAAGESLPEIIFFADLSGGGLGRDGVRQFSALKKFFKFDRLELRQESPEVKISWGESWGEKKKDRPEAFQTLAMNGREYEMRLIPAEINAGERIFRFRVEIYERKAESASRLKSQELILSRDALWNFGGPPAIGFFFGGTAYFITCTVTYEHFFLGGRLGAGFSEVL